MVIRLMHVFVNAEIDFIHGQITAFSRMFQQPEDRLQGAGAHIGARFCAFYDMQRIPDRSRQDLRFEALDLVYLGDLGDQLNAIPTAIVDPSDKGRNIVGAGFGGKDGLPGWEKAGYPVNKGDSEGYIN